MSHESRKGEREREGNNRLQRKTKQGRAIVNADSTVYGGSRCLNSYGAPSSTPPPLPFVISITTLRVAVTVVFLLNFHFLIFLVPSQFFPNTVLWRMLSPKSIHPLPCVPFLLPSLPPEYRDSCARRVTPLRNLGAPSRRRLHRKRRQSRTTRAQPPWTPQPRQQRQN